MQLITPVVELRGVEKAFYLESRRIEVLRGIDLQVSRGEAIAVVGRSGAGKSTLLHLVGLLDDPSRGEICVAGRSLQGMSDVEVSRLRNRTFGFVFQMHNLLAEFSALENVMLPGLIGRMARRDVTARAEQLLSQVGLGERLRHRPGELSGGEQQRVAIARALMMEPQILLADEPTGNLDAETARSVEDLLLSLCESLGMALLIVTHDTELAGRAAKVLTIHQGRLA